MSGLLTVLAMGLIVLVAMQIYGSARVQRRHHNRPASPPGYDVMRIRARMKRLARPTLLLTTASAAGFSKLGGEPRLPPDAEWPIGFARRPTAFLVQLDLAQVGAADGPDWLPKAGALYAFNDEDMYGTCRHVQVLFSADGEERPPRPWPPGTPSHLKFAERHVEFVRLDSLPSLDWLGVDVREIDVTEEELDQLADAPGVAFGDRAQHRIGGYPSEIQDACMPIECEHLARGLPPPVWGEEIPQAIERASKSWRLLLQIDSDPTLGMSWGDAGMLYVFVREAHARAGDFSRTVSIWQTH